MFLHTDVRMGIFLHFCLEEVTINYSFTLFVGFTEHYEEISPIPEP